MNAHEAKCFIKIVQILQLLKRLLGFNLLSHSDLLKTFVAQQNLNISPQIKLIKECEDP